MTPLPDQDAHATAAESVVSGKRRRAALFDLDCTLNDRPATIEAFAGSLISHFGGQLTSPAADICSAIHRADRAGYAPRSAVCTALADELAWHRRPDVSSLVAFWRNTFPACGVVRRGAAELLAALRREGLSLALVSNGDGHAQRRKLTPLALEGFFDVIVISGEVGLRKPDPAIYLHALNALEVKPADAWFVGDHPINDIDGARNAGLRTIWISGTHPWPIDCPAADAVVSQLDEILPLVQQSGG